MDNYATQTADKINAWFADHPHCPVRFTLTSTSWLSLVERFFSTPSEKWIKRQVHACVQDLDASIRRSPCQPSAFSLA